jgi:Tfp pilus assembly protein PilP
LRALLLFWGVTLISVSSGAVEPSPTPLAQPVAQAQPAQAMGLSSSEEALKIRDPFKRPDIEIAKAAPKSPLESYPLEQIKMVGVLTGPVSVRAMVLTPDGKTHFVSEKMKMGQRNGVVRQILGNSIIVRERIVDVLGQEENIDSRILMQADRSDDKKTGFNSAGLGEHL